MPNWLLYSAGGIGIVAVVVVTVKPLREFVCEAASLLADMTLGHFGKNRDLK